MPQFFVKSFLNSHRAKFISYIANRFLKLYTMDVAYLGAPFVYVPTKSSTNLQTIDVAYLGAPFVSYVGPL